MARRVVIRISDILDTSPDGICAVIAKTGRPAWLPRAHVDFFPGRVLVPEWLARRILDGKKPVPVV